MKRKLRLTVATRKLEDAARSGSFPPLIWSNEPPVRPGVGPSAAALWLREMARLRSATPGSGEPQPTTTHSSSPGRRAPPPPPVPQGHREPSAHTELSGPRHSLQVTRSQTMRPEGELDLLGRETEGRSNRSDRPADGCRRRVPVAGQIGGVDLESPRPGSEVRAAQRGGARKRPTIENAREGSRLIRAEGESGDVQRDDPGAQWQCRPVGESGTGYSGENRRLGRCRLGGRGYRDRPGAPRLRDVPRGHSCGHGERVVSLGEPAVAHTSRPPGAAIRRACAVTGACEPRVRARRPGEARAGALDSALRPTGDRDGVGRRPRRAGTRADQENDAREAPAKKAWEFPGRSKAGILRSLCLEARRLTPGVLSDQRAPDSDEAAYRSMKPSTRLHASAEASANSSCFRSKSCAGRLVHLDLMLDAGRPRAPARRRGTSSTGMPASAPPIRAEDRYSRAHRPAGSAPECRPRPAGRP